MRKVLVVITARPSYSRIKTALEAIRAHPDLELQLVVMASAILDRYGNVAEVIERDGFEISERLYTVLEGDHPLTMVKTTGLGMVDLANTFARLKPDVVVTIADRYETLATATAAAYMNIPLVHIQGGEVTGSIDDKVRNAVTQLADVHCVATETAGYNVVKMTEGPVDWIGVRISETIHVTGCPSIDLVSRIQGERVANFTYDTGTGPVINLHEPYIVALQHPVTDEDESAQIQAKETLCAVDDSGIPAVWFWPNVDAGSNGTSKALREFRESNGDAPIHFVRNIGPSDFVRLAGGAQCIVGNSSFGLREASFLGLPAINIGSRQSGRERGPNVVDVPHDREAIKAAILAQAGKRYERSTLYGDGHAGERIAEVIAKMEIKARRAA